MTHLQKEIKKWEDALQEASSLEGKIYCRNKLRELKGKKE